MTMKTQMPLRLLLLSLSASLLLACASDEPRDAELSESSNTSVTYTSGEPGSTQATINSIEAQVTAIDMATGKVTLQDEQGNQRQLTVTNQAVNLDQVEVGDKVLVQIAEEVAVFMREPGMPFEAADRSVSVKSPVGAKPAFLLADTKDVTAVISAVDIEQRRVTLQFSDDVDRSVPVRPDVQLSQDLVGRTMVIRTTNALAITVTGK